MSKKPTDQTRAPRAAPSDLPATLHALASNLHHDDSRQSLARLFLELIADRAQNAEKVVGLMNRGPDAALKDLLRGRSIADRGVLWPADPPDHVDRIRRVCERRLDCILEARRLIDGGAADGVQAASANHVTPTIIKATLGSVERHINIFLVALGRDGPLPRSTPDELAALSRVLRDYAHLVHEAGGIDAGKVAGAKAPDHPDDPPASPALNVNQLRVLLTMARFDASVLASAEMIVGEMDPKERLSVGTVDKYVRKLIDAGLAERPNGGKSGARLTIAGRRLAGKIED